MATTFPTTIETRDDAPDIPNVKNIGGVRDLETWINWISDAVIALQAKTGADSSSVSSSLDKKVTDAEATIATVGVLADVVVDHADSSPVTVLASSSVARNVLIIAQGTEAAGGGPDVDIGETDTTDKFEADFLAGAWAIGDGFNVVGTLTADKALLATIATAGSAGKIRVIVIGLPDLT